MQHPTSKLVLASSSPYRQNLLKRLQLDFTCHSPDIDETPQTGEPIENLVRRLARSKAERVAADHPQALVIGADQAALCDGSLLHKPGDYSHAFEQLQSIAGRMVTFHTGLCLLDAQKQHYWLDNVQYRVRMRALSAAQIERYFQREPAFDCAGSFKAEAYGITLFEAMEGEDPTALIGLPMIRLCYFLQEAGIALP